MRATLWGIDHEELGPIASATAGDRVALAITRGRFPKAYRYEDPNEDAVAAVLGPRATLLVCADGHHGASASHIAVQELLHTFGEDPPDDFSDDDWLKLFLHLNEVVIANKDAGSPQPASDTVLVAALVSRDRVSFGAIGDAALVVGRPGDERARQLNTEAMRFLGQTMSKRAMKSAMQRGSADLGAGEWVVLASDGLSEFVAPLRPADVVPRVLARREAATVEGAALELVETACNAGAGDNVAVAVLAP